MFQILCAYVLTCCLVLASASQFGERIIKDNNKNSTKTKAVPPLESKQESAPAPARSQGPSRASARAQAQPQASARTQVPPPAPARTQDAPQQRDKTWEKLSQELRQLLSDPNPFKFGFSTFHNNQPAASNNRQVQHRVGLAYSDEPRQTFHQPAYNNFGFNYPQASASGLYNSPAFYGPPPPKAPEAPQYQSPPQFRPFNDQQSNRQRRGRGQGRQANRQQPNHYLNAIPVSDFSFGVPQGFPNPKNVRNDINQNKNQ